MFLKLSMLFVKLIDKNLGIVVIIKDWYRAKCQEYLSNLKISTKVYNYNSVYNLQETLYMVYHKIELPGIYLKYIKTKIKTELPHFYIISKVHKKPWTSRLIVPSYSWITSRLLEVLNNFLRLLPKQFL